MKRIIVLTKDGVVTPMDVDWDSRLDVPDNVEKNVRHRIPKEFRDGGFVISPGRGYVWEGNKSQEWYWAMQSQEFFQATSMSEMDNTLWDKIIP